MRKLSKIIATVMTVITISVITTQNLSAKVPNQEVYVEMIGEEKETAAPENEEPRFMSIHEEMYWENVNKPVEEVIEEEPEPIIEEIDYGATEYEINLLALVTMAEAEGECELGKRYVIDTILNRKDSTQFPNSIYEVIYQPTQFTSMWNGRVDICYVRDDIVALVKEELLSRTNSEALYFQRYNYSKWGTPLTIIENHYFSK